MGTVSPNFKNQNGVIWREDADFFGVGAGNRPGVFLQTTSLCGGGSRVGVGQTTQISKILMMKGHTNVHTVFL